MNFGNLLIIYFLVKTEESRGNLLVGASKRP